MFSRKRIVDDIGSGRRNKFVAGILLIWLYLVVSSWSDREQNAWNRIEVLLFLLFISLFFLYYETKISYSESRGEYMALAARELSYAEPLSEFTQGWINQ